MNRTELCETARAWQANDPDPESRAELEALLTDLEDPESLETLAMAFAAPLAFGTAGLRGWMGPGPGQMNLAVVLKTTAGFAACLTEHVSAAPQRGVCIGYDARRNSERFAKGAASVLCAAGFKVFLFEQCVPTPILAYSILEQRAAGGIMVTASHNPPGYNGFKVYWENGAQIIPPRDAQIRDATRAVGPAKDIPTVTAPHPDLLGEATLNRYTDAVLQPLADNGLRPNIHIAYTPLHGVGNRFVHRVLNCRNYVSIVSVPEQAEPDGEFPTVAFPNPEEPGAMDAVLELAEKENADLALANDPDADRLAVAVPDKVGGWAQLTGNDVGILLADFVLSRTQRSPTRQSLVINTIVSSPMLEAVASAHRAAFAQTLTGFKWIANLAIERQGTEDFVFGYEEAIGYCVGEAVRDKDGISATLWMAELASSLKAEGKTILDELERLWRRDGLWLSSQVSLKKSGSDGQQQIERLMTRVRNSPLAPGGPARVRILDYLSAASGLPPTDAVRFDFEGRQRVMVRPSGTEPKVKVYFDIGASIRPDEPLLEAKRRAQTTLSSLQSWFLGQLDCPQQVPQF